MVYELERNSFSFASNHYGNKQIDSWQCLGLFPNLSSISKHLHQSY